MEPVPPRRDFSYSIGHQRLEKGGCRAESQDSRGFGRQRRNAFPGTVEQAKASSRSAITDMSPRKQELDCPPSLEEPYQAVGVV